MYFNAPEWLGLFSYQNRPSENTHSKSIKGLVPPKNENSVTVYSPLFLSRPVPNHFPVLQLSNVHLWTWTFIHDMLCKNFFWIITFQSVFFFLNIYNTGCSDWFYDKIMWFLEWTMPYTFFSWPLLNIVTLNM